jgi:hypothetical protein
VRVQTLRPETSVEGFDEGIVGGFARPGEVQRDASLIGPQIQIARDELCALIDTDRCREDHREHPKLPARRQLVMNKVHRPRLV